MTDRHVGEFSAGEIADAFGAIAAETLIDRGPPPVKATKGRARVLKVVDKAGAVVGYATHGEVLESAARVAEIEIAVQDGTKPDMILCIDCKMTRSVPKVGGGLPKRCRPCAAKKKRERGTESERKRRAKNPDAVKAQGKRSRVANIDKRRAKEREDYAKNREAIAEETRKRRESDIDEARRKQRARDDRYREHRKVKREAAKASAHAANLAS